MDFIIAILLVIICNLVPLCGMREILGQTWTKILPLTEYVTVLLQ